MSSARSLSGSEAEALAGRRSQPTGAREWVLAICSLIPGSLLHGLHLDRMGRPARTLKCPTLLGSIFWMQGSFLTGLWKRSNWSQSKGQRKRGLFLLSISLIQFFTDLLNTYWKQCITSILRWFFFFTIQHLWNWDASYDQWQFTGLMLPELNFLYEHVFPLGSLRTWDHFKLDYLPELFATHWWCEYRSHTYVSKSYCSESQGRVFFSFSYQGWGWKMKLSLGDSDFMPGSLMRFPILDFFLGSR